MWIEYNPNPKGKKTGDCSVRAVSKAIGTDWDGAFAEMSVYGSIECDMPNANSVFGACLRNHGYRRRIIPDDCPNCYSYTVKDFCRDHPIGDYVLIIHGHVVFASNGNWWDSWDSANEIVIYYFERMTNDV